MAADAEIYQGLTEVFHDVFGDDGLVLRPSMTADDVPGWDSVRMISIILGVEQRFAIKLRSRDVDQLKSVGGLADLVRSKLG